MQRLVRTEDNRSLRALLMLAPLVLALAAVCLEPFLPVIRNWAHGRKAALPLLMFLIGASLLNHRLRHVLIVSLCYGVALLALEDVFPHMIPWSNRQSPKYAIPGLDPDFSEIFIYIGLLAVTALSGVAAIGESLKPGTVWARRCYFGAAALYFPWQGLNSFGTHGSWQALMLFGTGITALFGCLFAPSIVASEQEEEAVEEAYNDEAEQKLREEKHLRALRDKEWRDPSADY